jgi:23S rRNA (cytosine1962-C5)-methyltransferase
MTPSAVVTRRGAERLQTGHPWIYRSDIIDATADRGDIVRVVTERSRPLGWAYWSSESQIAVRMVSMATGATLPDERELIETRIRAAAAYRASLGIADTAWRLVHAESDGLPATIVDRYGDEHGTWFVVQTLAQASDRRLALLVDILVELFQPTGVLARNDPRVRTLEGLDTSVTEMYGDVPQRVQVREGGVLYAADLRAGQKTGLFLDQRENHAAAARYAHGEVLDAFTYNGGFALQMAARASSVLALDSSAAAVAVTEANAELNGLANVEVREANVFDELRELEVSGRKFDTISLDPPAFAKTKASVERALGGYKEINLRALRLLRPGGHLITCSCSYNVDDALFLDVVRSAAADAHAGLWLVERRTQSLDHPTLVTVPETSYLKCLILRRVT